MKSRGGGRDGTWISGGDGLIAPPVQIRRMPNSSDVVWQRQFSNRLKLFVEIPRMMELQPKAAAAEGADNQGRHIFIDPNSAADRRFLGRIDDGDPQAALVREALQQQNFYLATAFLGTAKPRREYLRIVEHEYV